MIITRCLGLVVLSVILVGCQTTNSADYTEQHYQKDLYRLNHNWIIIPEQARRSHGLVAKDMVPPELLEKYKAAISEVKEAHGRGDIEQAIDMLHDMMKASSITHKYYVPPSVGR